MKAFGISEIKLARRSKGHLQLILWIISNLQIQLQIKKKKEKKEKSSMVISQETNYLVFDQ